MRRLGTAFMALGTFVGVATGLAVPAEERRGRTGVSSRHDRRCL